MTPSTHKHQRDARSRTRGTSIMGGDCGYAHLLAADEAQDWSALRGRAGFHATCTPLQSPGFLPCRAQLGRAFGLGSLSRRDVRSRPQFTPRFLTLDEIHELRICELTGRQAVPRALLDTGHHVIHDSFDGPEVSHSYSPSSIAVFDDQQLSERQITRVQEPIASGATSV